MGRGGNPVVFLLYEINSLRILYRYFHTFLINPFKKRKWTLERQESMERNRDLFFDEFFLLVTLFRQKKNNSRYHMLF